jgi:hypothetical protein
MVIKMAISYANIFMGKLGKTHLRRVPLVEQELLTVPWHPSSPTVFSGVRVTRSMVLCGEMSNMCFSNLPINRLAYESTIFLIIAVLFIYMMEIAYIQSKKSLRISKCPL